MKRLRWYVHICSCVYTNLYMYIWREGWGICWPSERWTSHICIYIIHIHKYTHTYIYTYTYVHTHTHTQTQIADLVKDENLEVVRVCVCVFMCVRARICVRIYACECVCKYIYVYIYIHMCVYIYTYTNIFIHTYSCTCMYSPRERWRTHSCIYTFKHIYISIYKCVHVVVNHMFLRISTPVLNFLTTSSSWSLRWGWVFLERTRILSGIQFTTHFIEFLVVETKRFVGSTVNVILTRQTCSQRSSRVVESKRRALEKYFSERICHMFSVSKCRGDWDLGWCTFWVLAKRELLRNT